MYNSKSFLLRGLVEYGDPLDDRKAWSVKWDKEDFSEFLFISGNGKYFLRAEKSEIIGEDGLKEYVNQPIQILSSHENCDISSGKSISTFTQ